MNARVLNDQAQDLVNTSVQDMQSGLDDYRNEQDLAILKIAYIIVRRRKETTKCKVLASKIRKLDLTLHPSKVPTKPKLSYIVIRCAMCRSQVGQGKGKAAAIVNAKQQGARIVPFIVNRQRKNTVICKTCFEIDPTVEHYGIRA